MIQPESTYFGREKEARGRLQRHPLINRFSNWSLAFCLISENIADLMICHISGFYETGQTPAVSTPLARRNLYLVISPW
jgi:hypothetical protein